MRRTNRLVWGRGALLCAGASIVWFFLSVAIDSAFGLPAFTNANGGISFGVAPLGPPVSPGAPTYLLNNFNGRQDILTNPGLGLTANPSIPNNTSSVGPLAWGPGQFIFLTQVGGGNVNGNFGTGTAAINGPQFNYALSDGGVPGGTSASYEILTWDAGFNDAAGTNSPVGGVSNFGTFISMAGQVPLNQDLAMVSLRTQLTSPNAGNVFLGGKELPGLILAVERTGPLTYNAIALQDNGLGGLAPMPGGWAILIHAPTGNFRALAFNAFHDNSFDGVNNGIVIPAGTNFTARVTATIYSDPSSLHFTNPFNDPELIAAAVAQSGTPFPTNFLFTHVPEPMAIQLAMMGVAIAALRRRRKYGSRRIVQL